MLRAMNLARRIRQRIGAAVAIRVGNAIHVAGERLESCLIRMRLTSHGHRHVSATVKGVFEADDSGPLRVTARDLDGVFGGLGAGVDQQGFLLKLSRREGVEFLTDCDVALVGKHIETGVQETVKLAAYGFDHGGGAVSSIEAANAAGKID